MLKVVVPSAPCRHVARIAARRCCRQRDIAPVDGLRADRVLKALHGRRSAQVSCNPGATDLLDPHAATTSSPTIMMTGRTLSFDAWVQHEPVSAWSRS